LPQFIVINYLI